MDAGEVWAQGLAQEPAMVAEGGSKYEAEIEQDATTVAPTLKALDTVAACADIKPVGASIRAIAIGKIRIYRSPYSGETAPTEPYVFSPPIEL